MEITDWINIIAAILVGGGTLFLGIMAWRTIRQTRIIQETEKGERLLNEIIEWAINITKCPFEKDFRDIIGATNVTKVQLFTYNHIVEVKESFMGMTGRSEYISKIVLKFKQDLQKAVKELKKDLEANIKLFDEWQHAMADDLAMDISDYAEKAEAHGRQLDKSVNKVIDEAAKIKTKDIGKEEHMSKKEETTRSDETTLKDIEEHLKDIKRSSIIADNKWNIGFGVTAMVIAYSWLTDNLNKNDFSGIVIGVLGILLLIWPGYSRLFSSLWHKWRSKREQ